MASALFTCKGLSGKDMIAMQILGYTTISLLSEKFEEVPRATIEGFKTVSSMVDSVDICMQLWKIVCEESYETYLIGIQTLATTVTTQAELEKVIDEIIVTLKDNVVADPFRIIDELLEDESLSEERIGAISAALCHPLPPTSQPTTTQTKRIGRSQTLRVHGRRALTPMRSRNRRNKKIQTQ